MMISTTPEMTKRMVKNEAIAVTTVLSSGVVVVVPPDKIEEPITI